MINTLLINCAILYCCVPVHEFLFNEQSPRPGGIAIVRVADAQTDYAPVVLFEGKKALMLRLGDKWAAIIGIPLDHEIGPAEATVRSEARSRKGAR